MSMLKKRRLNRAARRTTPATRRSWHTQTAPDNAGLLDVVGDCFQSHANISPSNTLADQQHSPGMPIIFNYISEMQNNVM